MFYGRRELISHVEDEARRELLILLMDGYIFGKIADMFASESEWPSDDRYNLGGPILEAGPLGTFNFSRTQEEMRRKVTLRSRGLDAEITLLDRKGTWDDRCKYLIIYQPTDGRRENSGLVQYDESDGGWGIYWFPIEEEEPVETKEENSCF